MSEKTNESRIRNAGLRMALKLIPQDLLDQAPATLEKYLLNQIIKVEPEHHEAGACYVIAPSYLTEGPADAEHGPLKIMLCTLDENCAIDRIVKETTLSELFRSILDEMKEM